MLKNKFWKSFKENKHPMVYSLLFINPFYFLAIAVAFYIEERINNVKEC